LSGHGWQVDARLAVGMYAAQKTGIISAKMRIFLFTAVFLLTFRWQTFSINKRKTENI